MQSRLIPAAALAIMSLVLSTAKPTLALAQDVQSYECTAQKRLAGREEAAADSPQTRMPDGQPRYVEKGDPGYTGVEMGKAMPEWIELYGAQNGHASSFLGFYLSKDFKCGKAQG